MMNEKHGQERGRKNPIYSIAPARQDADQSGRLGDAGARTRVAQLIPSGRVGVGQSRASRGRWLPTPRLCYRDTLSRWWVTLYPGFATAGDAPTVRESAFATLFARFWCRMSSLRVAAVSSAFLRSRTALVARKEDARVPCFLLDELTKECGDCRIAQLCSVKVSIHWRRGLLPRLQPIARWWKTR